jgi:hypothetical protein
LARKSDGMPGTLTLWRGWKRVTDLTRKSHEGIEKGCPFLA